MKLKKLVGLFLTAALSVTLLAGCGDNKDNSNSSDSGTTSESTDNTDNTGDDQSADNVSSDEEVKLTFLVWGESQNKGMQAMCDAYTAQHPNVTIEVQSTGWNEYWTKLEASATGNTMPDIFWMHTNELLKYADNGILADVTDLYEDSYYTDHFSDVSISNTQGSDGNMYGVPKDKDTISLIYNKEIFDEVGLDYPDENWTWENITEASEKIYAETGNYGFLANLEDQAGYWNFVYQAGGYILDEDKTTAGFTQPATIKGMEFYFGMQNEEWCPDQAYFAETDPATTFFSGKAGMFLEGSWNLKDRLDAFPEMVGKWDVAVLPKCADPESGDGRATISNGLSYATAAKGKNVDVALDVIKFFGTEEAMKIQGESGAAIPAYLGTEETFTGVFDQYDYRIDVEKHLEMLDYSVQSVNNASRPEWKPKVNDELLKALSGEMTLTQAIENCQKIVDEASK